MSDAHIDKANLERRLIVKSISEYWKNLTLIRKVLLMIGMTIMLPVTIILILVAGSVEAYKFAASINY